MQLIAIAKIALLKKIPVFGIYGLVMLIPACSATETSLSMVILHAGFIFGRDIERFAHFTAKNLNEIGLIGEKSHSKM